MNTKLDLIGDSDGHSLNLSVTAGQVSDHIGARALVNRLPKVDWLRGPRIWCRPVHRSVSGQKDTCLLPLPEPTQETGEAPQAPRKRRNRIDIVFDRLRGLAACGNPRRLLSLGPRGPHRTRRNRHLLTMRPDPRNEP